MNEQAVKTVISERGWSKQGTNAGGGLCLALAARHAGVNDDLAMVRRLETAIEREWPGRMAAGFVPAFQCQREWWNVASFNDHPDTTESHVLRALEAAERQ